MDKDSALEYVRIQADTDSEPRVSDSEILSILNEWRIQDRDGNAPSSNEWSESYWIPRVVAEVISLRVLRASNWVDSSTDGTSFSASQAVEALRKQESRWRRRCVVGL